MGKIGMAAAFVLAGCSGGRRIPADGGPDTAAMGGPDGGSGDAAVAEVGESAGLDATGASAAFAVYPPEMRTSGQAGFGLRNTITVTANVDLTDLSVTLSSGDSIQVVNDCPASLAAGQSCSVGVITCPAGTYSTYQASGEVLIRTRGEHDLSLAVPIHASCHSS